MGRFYPTRYSLVGPASRVLLLLVFLGVMVGCGRGTFVGRQYQDFTAYYNTFYNATKAFEKGVESVTPEERDVNRNRYLSIFLQPQEGSNVQSFEKAIEKSADVLREHPNSRWVDDAVLLIGKSYFYQENYVGAAQKFREGVALGTERQAEARFWLARTLVVTERYTEAADVLASALDGTEEEDVGPWMARMYLVRGELFVRQERWEEAERALQQGALGPLPDELAARSTFLLGQVRETLDRHAAAEAAYRLSAEHTSSFELGFAAQLKAIELKGLHGNTERALEQLKALERNDKYYQKRGEMAVVRARLYRAQGRPDKAKEVLSSILHQTESPSGATRGRLYYELATLHREDYEDFSQSAAYYDTAATAMDRRSGGQGRGAKARAVPWAPSDAGTQAQRLQGLAQQSERVARMDSLLRLGRMSEEELQAVVGEMRQRRQAQREASAANREQARGQSRSQFRPRRGQQGRPSQQSEVAAQTRRSEAGFLFHKDPARVQEGRRQFQQTWGNRPRVDNWRRRAAIREGSTSDVASRERTSDEGGRPDQNTSSPSDRVEVDLSEVPRDSASQAQMEADRAVTQYELANSLFRAAGRPDSAATWYRRIIEENTNHPVARQALYALAEAYRAMGDSAKARKTYRQVIEKYPESAFAERAKERLGEAPTAPVTDQTEQADSAYARAYQQWQNGNLWASMEKLLAVADTYSSSEVAPKALLAAGVVYRRLVQRDSLGARRQLLAFLNGGDSPERSRYSLGLDTTLTDSTLGRQPSVSPSDTTSEGQTRSSASVSAQPDSSGTNPKGASGAPADSTTDPFMALMNHLMEQYPDAPQTKRAQLLLRRLQGPQTAADADTSTVSPQKDSTVVADRGEETDRSVNRASGVPDTVRARSSPNERAEREGENAEEDQDPLPAPTSPSSEQVGIPRTPLDPSAEGWTLLVQTYADRDEAMTHLRSIEQEVDERWPVDVLTDSNQSSPRFRLVVGHFETKKAARQGRERLNDRLPGQPELWSLSSPNEDS